MNRRLLLDALGNLKTLCKTVERVSRAWDSRDSHTLSSDEILKRDTHRTNVNAFCARITEFLRRNKSLHIRDPGTGSEQLSYNYGHFEIIVDDICRVVREPHTCQNADGIVTDFMQTMNAAISDLLDSLCPNSYELSPRAVKTLDTKADENDTAAAKRTAELSAADN